MLTIHNNLSCQLHYPIQHPYTMEEILFFDIETTGLSAKTSYLYLIGCVYFENKTWQITQWLADDINSEAEILYAFFNKLRNYKRIIHYNGSGFDIPFIQNKCKQYNIEEPFDQIESFDIYKKLQPYKKLLPLQNLKLKTIEEFLGISREDTYSGADLIQVYANYLGSNRYEKLHASSNSTRKESVSNKIPSSKELLNILLLHNKEDIENLITISNILCYIDIFDIYIYKNIFLNYNNIVDDQKKWNTEIYTDETLDRNFFVIHLTIPYEIPSKIHWENKDLAIEFIGSSNNITIKIPIFKGVLKYYYENYKDYYYLPKEDMAIHKSVAQFVDKEYRKQAKANTCYTKKTGLFIPRFGETLNPIFKIDYKDPVNYIEYNSDTFEDPNHVCEYVTNCIGFLIQSKQTKLIFQ